MRQIRHDYLKRQVKLNSSLHFQYTKTTAAMLHHIVGKTTQILNSQRYAAGCNKNHIRIGLSTFLRVLFFVILLQAFFFLFFFLYYELI